MTLARAVLLGLVTAVLAGCNLVTPAAKMGINHYFADARDVGTVRRVLVLPMQVSSGVNVDEAMIREMFIRELNLLQRFQVESIPQGEDEEVVINAAFTRGKVSIPALVNLAKRYRLDGIILGRITSYRAYTPPHLGLEARMFSLHTGSWVWIADATFDMNSAICASDLNHYVDTVIPSPEVSEEGARMVALGPRKFAAYACHRILGTWR